MYIIRFELKHIRDGANAQRRRRRRRVQCDGRDDDHDGRRARSAFAFACAARCPLIYGMYMYVYDVLCVCVCECDFIDPICVRMNEGKVRRRRCERNLRTNRAIGIRPILIIITQLMDVQWTDEIGLPQSRNGDWIGLMNTMMAF